MLKSEKAGLKQNDFEVIKVLIGLTGKSGSGKTYASAYFKKLGAYVIDCDRAAHNALTFPSVKEKIKNTFGEAVFTKSEVDRKKLGRIVFSDPKLLKKLNEIVHPEVTDFILSETESLKDQICIIDGSELEESGIDEKCKFVIVICADEKIRLERIIKRDSIAPLDAQRRIDAQKDYSKKALLIENNSTRAEFEKKLGDVYSFLRMYLNEKDNCFNSGI